MFYSETLLSKTGPLARVWLSANLERKLSKNHILQSSVKDSVEAIVTPNQAPLALRLSGQLLLGVVRIYSRKARYLLDDCNEALMKIKLVPLPPPCPHRLTAAFLVVRKLIYYSVGVPPWKRGFTDYPNSHVPRSPHSPRHPHRTRPPPSLRPNPPLSNPLWHRPHSPLQQPIRLV